MIYLTKSRKQNNERNQIENSEHENSEMKYILICNDKINSICCESEKVKLQKSVELNWCVIISHDSALTGIVIDMKNEYRCKTKEELVSTLIKVEPKSTKLWENSRIIKKTRAN